MPIVTVQMFEGRTVEQKRALAKAITDAVVEHAKTTAEGTTVVFVEMPRENWATAGKLASD